MSISYSTRDIMYYDLFWDVSNSGVTMNTWMLNEQQIPWEFDFFGKHWKVLKMINDFNARIYMGRLIYDETTRTMRFSISNPVYTTFIKTTWGLFTINISEYVTCIFRSACWSTLELSNVFVLHNGNPDLSDKNIWELSDRNLGDRYMIAPYKEEIFLNV